MFFIPALAIAAEFAVPTLATLGFLAVNTAATVRKARRKKVCVPLNRKGSYLAGVLVKSSDIKNSGDLQPYKGFLKKNADNLGLSKGKRKSLGI